MANIPLKSIKFPGLDDTYTVPQVDADLDTTGAAADAKATGDALTEINERLDTLGYQLKEPLVYIEGDTVTLENEDAISNIISGRGLSNGTLSDGVKTFTIVEDNTQKNLFLYHMDMSLGQGKWLVGIKYKITKLDPNLGDPQEIRIYFNQSNPIAESVVWGEWTSLTKVFTGDLNRFDLYFYGFAVVPEQGQLQIQVKDFYIYQVDDISDDMLAYIAEQQEESFADGTVTYTEEGRYTVDSTLTKTGKAADAGAVRTALASIHQIPSGGSEGQVLSKVSGTDYDVEWVDQSGGSSIIDDTAGDGDTDKVWSASKTYDEVNAVHDELQDILVLSSGVPSATLTNALNVSSFVSGITVNGYGTPTVSGGVALFTCTSSNQKNPYVNKSVSLGSGKWLWGFKLRISKLDGTLGNPNEIRLYYNYTKIQTYAPTWGEWIDCYYVGTADISALQIYVYGFETAPTAGQFTLEIKEMYVYEVTGVEDNTLAYVISEQNRNYTDGTVTYGGNGKYVPDTDLNASGKAADSKAVGDAISAIRQLPSGGSSGQVLELDGNLTPTWINQSGGNGYTSESIPFSVDNSYINTSGEVVSATGYAVTDYIDVTDADAISFAGTMGTQFTVFWYDSSKQFISAFLKPQEKMIWFYNILTLKPATAKYVRCVSKKTTASNPPPVSPEVTVFYGKGYLDGLLGNIVGDGVTDDTMAVRRVVNMGSSIVFPKVENIKLTGSVSIGLGYAKVIDGNGVTLITSSDFYALTVEGTLTSSAAPSSIDDYVLQSEGGTLIENFKITSSSASAGGGIDVSKAFNLKIENNYIYRCNNGIRLSNMDRDIVISDNHIFAINANGILFDEDVNLHQCNIVNNIILFALNDIHIYNPSAIANFQITGNDIEIVNYPSTGYNIAKCICFESGSNETAPSMFAEIEICGNTIQGHSTSTELIYFSGHEDMPISDMSITGNHISNSNDHAIYMANCLNVAISGNNYNEIKHYVYDLDGLCENILIVGDVARGVNEGTVAAGGKVHASSSAVLKNIKCKNVICTTNNTNNIETSNVTNVDLD